ncbi:MAG: anhydro-N-acetylmuramic acid kinase [Gammaproteobacteria bacterium]|nr:anhydro-N-acetylmuramic acid kinase [Gammaproteobacteria bacterium]NNF61086.1 anhydro-N-acetylmuramic acid kinase [Gammaproteobacteria bacterium]NNM21401.1 anhydro-N-acetylmuramic acid kinase [Gammaproteobacteria bacterium]
MSGTSMDSVDAGLLTHSDSFHLERGISHPFPAELHGRLRHLVDHADKISLDELGQIDTALGACFAETAIALLEAAGLTAADVTAIGSHGQTIRHRPTGAQGFTMQIGDPNVIASRTGITTIADFRRRDVALGGHGAPLAPAFHHAVFARSGEEQAVINIGGMSNITTLHADGSVTGHDTGPGNVLMDAWSRQHHAEPFDDGGAWAQSGTIDSELLALLRSEEYFRLAPPKSTGRELFNLPWLTGHLLSMAAAPEPADVQATLSELTALVVAEAVRTYAPAAQRCLVCGGGAYNTFLMQRLAAHLPQVIIETTQSRGIAPEWVEAGAFAWLAMQTLAGRAGNIIDVTGASRPAILGAIYSAG